MNINFNDNDIFPNKCFDETFKPCIMKLLETLLLLAVTEQP